MSVGVHSFEIPHDAVEPTRDMVIIRIPYPPRKVGNIITPDVSRDLMQHSVLAGMLMKKGPLAFSYKDGDGLSRQTAEIGDWVLIRPFAGVMMTGSQAKTINCGFRYVSSFADVIGIISASAMPDPSMLDWTGEEPSEPKTAEEVPSQPRSREKIVVTQ